MATEKDPDRIAEELRHALSSRMDSARSLAKSKEHTAQAREDAEKAETSLEEAKQEEARRYRQARETGWTDDDLRQAGLTDPVTGAPPVSPEPASPSQPGPDPGPNPPAARRVGQ